MQNPEIDDTIGRDEAAHELSAIGKGRVVLIKVGPHVTPIICAAST